MMAHHVDPMDVDCVESEFDNKENTFHLNSLCNNVLPCTEKGYEELDVSELNMKLRYSMTPASSPMSKSYTAYLDSNILETDGLQNSSNEIVNLTRSLNSTITKNDSVIKSLKNLPLQPLPAEQCTDSNGNPSALRQLDSTVTDDANITITYENLSSPSSSSSALHTPEPNMPTKEIPKDGGSPIMRGLKSVLNMFRPSQSPIPLMEGDDTIKQEALSPAKSMSKDNKLHTMASTPIASHRTKDGNGSKRNSPYKDSIVFKDDLEKELNWNDETTILFSDEKIPVHKLFLQQTKNTSGKSDDGNEVFTSKIEENCNPNVEYMDVSFNESLINKTMPVLQTDNIKCEEVSTLVESDNEFLDCETTFSKNESNVEDGKKIEDIIDQTVDVTKDLTFAIDNTPALNSATSDIIGLSLIDGDFNNDTTEPTDHSDYSKETIELLSELEMFEENVPENNVVYEKPANTHEIPTNNDSETDQQEPKVRRIKPNQCNMNFAWDGTLDHNTAEITLADQKVLHTTIVQDLDLSKSQSTAENLISKNMSDSMLSEKLNVTQNIISTDIVNVFESQIVPHEEISANIFYEKQSEETLKMVPSETSNGTIPEKINEIILENPSDIPLPDENPSDIPLPDEDDIEKESLKSETLNMTNTLSKSDVPEVILHPSDAVSDDKSQNNSIESETLNAMLSEKEKVRVFTVPDRISMESKSDVNKKTIGEMLHDNKIENAITIPELSSVTLEIDSETPPEAQKLTTSDPKSDKSGLESIDKSFNKNMDENIPLSGIAAESLQYSTTKVDITYEHSSHDANQTIDDTLCASTSNTTTVQDNIEKCENRIQVEPLDIMKSKSFNQMHDLPDVLHQAIYENEDHVQNLIKTVDTAVAPKSDDFTVTSANTIANLEALELKDSTKTDCDLKLEHDSTIVKAITVQQNEICTESQKNQCSIIHLTNVNEIQSDIVSENIQTSGIRKDSDKQLSPGGPSATVTNTSNVLNLSLEKPTADEEILVSENNSPYVSLMVSKETNSEKMEEVSETIDTSFVAKTNLSSSPPIISKGYNFNFDEMDDPFATKTKIRMSPSPASPTKPIEMEVKIKNQCEVPKKEVANGRKSQPPERRKPGIIKKKINATFYASSSSKKSENKTNTVAENDDVQILSYNGNENLQSFDKADITRENFTENKYEDPLSKSEENFIHKFQDPETNEENKSSIESNVAVSTDTKTTSSSEQSTYYSAGNSSTEFSQSKNVFNLPEIDDVNFNPFATKSKMRQSPPPQSENNPFAAKTNIKSYPDTSVVIPHLSDSNFINEAKPAAQLVQKFDPEGKMETELMEKDSFGKNTNTTSSSQCTDEENLTTHEIKTEDEDTVEGPFIEAEDVLDKMVDLDADVGMLQINNLPAQEAEDSNNRELFIDAEAFEFLLNQNNNDNVADSGKESLFLKFDPLFANKISSDGVLAALSNIQKRQSTPKKPSQTSFRNEVSPIAGPSNLDMTYEADHNISHENDDNVNITIAKPMMAVTPAINPAVTPRNKSITPTRSNRHSITFTSPAIAVIDRLLSMSGNSSILGHDTTIIQTNRDQTEADLALIQLRELLAEKEISVYNLRSESKELKDRLATMESQVKILEADGQDRLKKIKELNERLAEKTKINKNMAAVVEEYERTIASLIAEIEQDKKRNNEERNRLINERDEQTAHLASMEVSFSDLHSKYEKSKQIIFSCKANEDAYKKSIKDLEENLAKLQTNYEMLKQHATSKLNYANEELVKINRAHEAEVLKMNAMIKRKDLHITSLEETLAQKTKANEELTAICDELINKVG